MSAAERLKVGEEWWTLAEVTAIPLKAERLSHYLPEVDEWVYYIPPERVPEEEGWYRDKDGDIWFIDVGGDLDIVVLRGHRQYDRESVNDPENYTPFVKIEFEEAV